MLAFGRTLIYVVEIEIEIEIEIYSSTNATSIHNNCADHRWLVAEIRVLMKKNKKKEHCLMVVAVLLRGMATITRSRVVAERQCDAPCQL